jgi:hypothetical protein
LRVVGVINNVSFAMRIITNIFLLLVVCLNCSFGQDNNKEKYHNLEQDIYRAFDSLEYGQNNGAFACPLYFLYWSEAVFDRLKIDGASSALDLAKAAKTVAEQTKKLMLTYEDPFRFEQKFYIFHETMILYLEEIINAAVAQIDYIESGDDAKKEEFDRYLSKAIEHGYTVESFLGNSLLSKKDSLGIARIVCPRWLRTFAEMINFRKEDVFYARHKRHPTRVNCADCNAVIGAAKVAGGIFQLELADLPETEFNQDLKKYAHAIVKLMELHELYYAGADLEAIDSKKKEEYEQYEETIKFIIEKYP